MVWANAGIGGNGFGQQSDEGRVMATFREPEEIGHGSGNTGTIGSH